MKIEKIISDFDLEKQKDEEIEEVEKPRNSKPKRKSKKIFEIKFPRDLLEVLKTIIANQNQSLFKIVEQDSIIDYLHLHKTLKKEKKVFLDSK